MLVESAVAVLTALTVTVPVIAGAGLTTLELAVLLLLPPPHPNVMADKNTALANGTRRSRFTVTEAPESIRNKNITVASDNFLPVDPDK
jgi:hypothetical protein